MPDTNTRIVLVIKDEVPEQSTWRYSGKLHKENGQELTLAELEDFRISIYALDKNSTIINSVDKQDAMNINRGTIENDGSFVIESEPLDNIIVDVRKTFERHRMLIEWQYGGGRKGKRIVDFVVMNLKKVA